MSVRKPCDLCDTIDHPIVELEEYSVGSTKFACQKCKDYIMRSTRIGFENNRLGYFDSDRHIASVVSGMRDNVEKKRREKQQERDKIREEIREEMAREQNHKETQVKNNKNKLYSIYNKKTGETLRTKKGKTVWQGTGPAKNAFHMFFSSRGHKYCEQPSSPYYDKQNEYVIKEVGSTQDLSDSIYIQEMIDYLAERPICKYYLSDETVEYIERNKSENKN